MDGRKVMTNITNPFQDLRDKFSKMPPSILELAIAEVRKLWNTKIRYRHLVGAKPSMVQKQDVMPYPLVIGRHKVQNTRKTSSTNRISGRLIVSVDNEHRITDIWYKE